MDRKWLILSLALLTVSWLAPGVVWAGTSVTPTPSPTPAASDLVCKSLKIVSGNGSTAPAAVEFVTEVEDGRVSSYRYHFGDGVIEVADARVKHTYTAGGTYVASVEVRDSEGNWVTSPSCEQTVTLSTSMASQHKAACGEVRIVSGQESPAPATVQVAVSASDNSGSIQAYRVTWGDGSAVEELTRSTFDHIYTKAGSYPVVVVIKDSKGVWQEGEAEQCKTTVKIVTATAMTEQPETGVGSSILLITSLSGLLGVGLLRMRQAMLIA